MNWAVCRFTLSRTAAHLKEMTAMERTLRPHLLIGVAAAAGVAAMLSAATAPTARADDFSDIISAVESDFTAGQTDFGAAETAFGSSNVEDGLTDLYNGVNTDFLSAPQDFLIGTSEEADSESLSFIGAWGIDPVSSFSEGLSNAEGALTEAQTYFTDAFQELAGGDYGYAVYYDAIGADYASIFPLEELLLGAASSF
jgi:hypothetical protein